MYIYGDKLRSFESFLSSLNKLPVSKNRIFYPVDNVRITPLNKRSPQTQFLYEFEREIAKFGTKIQVVGPTISITKCVEKALLGIVPRELYLIRSINNKTTVFGIYADELQKLVLFMQNDIKLEECKHFPEFNGMTYKELPTHLRARIEQTKVTYTEIEKSSTEVVNELVDWTHYGHSLFTLREFIFDKYDYVKQGDSHTALKCFESIWVDVFIEDSKLEVWKDDNKRAALVFIILELYYAPQTPFISVDLLIDAVYKDMCHNWSGEYFAAVKSHLNALPAWPDINKATGPDKLNHSREFGKYINSHLSNLDKYAVGFESFTRRVFNYYKHS